MSQFYISKIKIRRGTNDQRLLVRLDQGELAYTIDTNRLYVGNGTTMGGVAATNKISIPLSNVNSLTALYSEVGDIVSIRNIWYQLTASPHTNLNNWGRLAQNTSNEFFYDQFSALTISPSGLSASRINPNTVSNGVMIKDNILQLNVDTNFFGISANKITLNPDTITKKEISDTSFGDGIVGGNDNPITLSVNTDQFKFNSRQLNLNYDAITKVYPPQSDLTSLTGLINSSLGAPRVGDMASIDGIFYQLTTTPSTDIASWSEIDNRKSVERSIFGTLTGNSTNTILNRTNTLSSIFNGTPLQTLSGGIPNIPITRFNAMSSNGIDTVNITLSSAGFITFEGNSVTKTGQAIGRFAIPIFAY